MPLWNHHCHNQRLFPYVTAKTNTFITSAAPGAGVAAIVNNESSEIIRMLNTEFNELAKNPGLDLYPAELRAQIDDFNAWVWRISYKPRSIPPSPLYVHYLFSLDVINMYRYT